MELFGQDHLNHHATIAGGVLAEECAAVVSEFFARKRGRKTQEVPA